ncbi:sensor histidine kinase [Streptomyces sp. NPDC047130]|uniref:sensor histidine kinase n=1 Tax=Streptomyces sp. NPDC047130 TaxID=3155261 RepID=UPI0033EFF1EF
MSPRQRPDSRPSEVRALRWNSAGWILFGPLPPAVAALDAAAARRAWLLGLLALIALCHVLAFTRARRPVLPPRAYLTVLALVLGATSYLLGGGAAFYTVSLPQFWLLGRTPRQAITLSGAAAALTVLGGVLDQGWSPQLLTGNAAFTVVAYAAGVATGLWAHRLTARSEARQAQLAAELASSQAELAAAYQRQGAAEERERLAREIHDTLAQGFASIVVLAEAARAAAPTDPARCVEQLTSIERTARENLAEARVLVGAAPESGVAAGPPAATLRRTLDRFAQDTGLAVTAELPDIDVDLDRRTRVALLRCTQETLANVRKHAGASTVGVVLTEIPGGIELEITDDGRGFVVEEARGFGLDGMRRRLAELDGDLSVTSSLGDGTRVLVTLPAQSQDGR